MKDDREDLYTGLRQAGVVMTIPMMLAAGPLLGFFAGQWLDRRLGTSWFSTVLALVGFAAGVNETIRVIRILQRDRKNGR
ncbi:MAG: AtpZ/AtpI family protein [Planctomycetes bacterium]|nr:AtpZ/AtpI family protein [Planctomycetota bacterium]